jgi:hypothetical protein
LALIALCFCTAGCGPSDKPLSESEKNLKALSVFYGQYLGTHRGQSPPDEAEFKKYVRSLPAEQLKVFNVEPGDVDKLFISPRDNQPYGIAYKSKAGPPGESGAPMVIWEQSGRNGKRYVADAVGKVEEIDDATFQKRLATVPSSK